MRAEMKVAASAERARPTTGNCVSELECVFGQWSAARREEAALTVRGRRRLEKKALIFAKNFSRR